MKHTLLFIHGTGVRANSFGSTLRLIREKAAKHLPGWRIEGWAWGDAFGAKPNMGHASIPKYEESGNAAPALEAADRARWVLLAGDPLLELRTAPVEAVIGASPGPAIWKQLLALSPPPEPVRVVLASFDAEETWKELIEEVAKDPAWQDLVQKLTIKGPAVNDKIARALAMSLQQRLRHEGFPGPTHIGRDELVAVLTAALGGALGLKDWLARGVTAVIKPRRGRVFDAIGPAVGDILRYQARGGPLREFIGAKVAESKAEAIIAHSLGGIAAVDWLAEGKRDIKSLVTVGSQAPYFYEIDALCSRVWGNGLPEYFPKRWLNIYDERDFLSFQAETVFPGIVKDVEADNGQPFPDSHSAYWHNDEQVWKPIAQFLGH